MLAKNMRFPALFRTWTPAANQAYGCTIIEAVRATTAAPTFFKAVEFGEPTKQRYLDGGLRCNNPILQVVEEAKILFRDRPISCVVSLGTGIMSVIGLEQPDTFQNFLPSKFIRVLKGIATDCEQQSEAMAKQLHLSENPNSYFRLNVDEGLQGVTLAEWNRLNEVETHTVQYLRKHEVGQKVDQLVQILKGMSIWIPRLLKAEINAPEPGTTRRSPPTRLSEDEREGMSKLLNSIAISAYHDSRERSTSSGCLPGTRRAQIDTITKWIEAEDGKKPLFVVLGPAGSGKTSLLGTIAQICKDKGCYAASFFFSATDNGRNNEARLINTIAYQVATAVPELQPYIGRVVAADPTILSLASETQMKTLFLDVLGHIRFDYPNFSIQPRVVLIDALDECGDLTDQLRVVSALSEMLSHKAFPFLVLLSSRFNPHIENELSNVLKSHLHDQVILGKNGKAEQADIRAYLHTNMKQIRDKHTFRARILPGWPAASALETVVKRSGGQFIYAATVIKYIGSPFHDPSERFQHILGSLADQSSADPFAALDELYRTLMSLVEDTATALEILGIHLVMLNSTYWLPKMSHYPRYVLNQKLSTSPDILLAPLAPVLKFEAGAIEFHHSSFAEFLLDPVRSREYFVQPTLRHRWLLSQLMPFLYTAKGRTYRSLLQLSS